MKRAILAFCLANLFLVRGVHAQVPVIDAANLSQSQQTATNTKQILSTDQDILSNVQKTLQAVTGDRSSLAQGPLAQMALGGGFSMGSAPSLGSVISGGPLSFAGLGGDSQQIISSLINGLNLVKTLSGLQGALPSDKAYVNSSNTAQLILGLINSTQGTVKSASNAYTSGGQ
ncbi:MAG: conjugal transfer protein, partial [Hyphomicrobiales bacterium]